MKGLYIFLAFCVMLGCQPSEQPETVKKTNLSIRDSLLELIGKYPDSLMLRDQLIEEFSETGDQETAIRLVNEGIERDSLNHYWHSVKSKLQFLRKDTIAAIESMKQAVSISPTSEYLISLGFLYAQSGKKQAISTANLLMRPENNKLSDAFLMMGMYYNNTRQPDSAILSLDKCINSDYTCMDAYREKAIALLSQSKPDKALTVLEQAIQVNHNYEEAFYYKGICLEKLKKTDDAIMAYKAAWALDNGYEEAITALKRLGVEFEN